MTTDLVTWLRQQLDEDEQSIRIWGNACWHVDACDETGDYLKRFDEDRMLAEVDAKRRILDLHSPGKCADGPDIIVCGTCGPHGGDPAAWLSGIEWWPCATVKLLALPYADRPGYDESWRP